MPIELFEPKSPKFQERPDSRAAPIEWSPPEYEKPFAGNLLPLEPKWDPRPDVFGPRDTRSLSQMPNDADGLMQIEIEGHESRWQKDGSKTPFRNVR